jgi:hypothetical protein
VNGAEVDPGRAEPHQVGDDPAHLAGDHPQDLAALGDLETHQLLDPEREPDVVRHRREVVGPVGEGDDLIVLAVLTQLLEAGVEIADVRNHPDHRLAVQLDHQPQHAVRRRVLGTDVDQHVLGAEPLVELAGYLVLAGILRLTPRGI